MISRMGDRYREAVGPFASTLARAGVTGNALTVIGLMIVFGSAAMIAVGQFFAGGVVFLLGAVADSLDGAVAKAQGNSGSRGAFFDSTCDRFADGAVLGGLAWYLARVNNTTGLALALVALVAAFVTPYIKARANALGVACDVGLVQRTERVLITGACLLFSRPWLLAGVLAATGTITVGQRFVHVWRQTAP